MNKEYYDGDDNDNDNDDDVIDDDDKDKAMTIMTKKAMCFTKLPYLEPEPMILSNFF